MNPVESDGKLQKLLNDLPYITTGSQLLSWRLSFLKRYDSLLNEGNKENARRKYHAFVQHNSALLDMISQLQSRVEIGDIADNSCSTRGRQCVCDCSNKLEDVSSDINQFLCSTKEIEEQNGFDAFHVGALFIRDNFCELRRLTSADKHIEAITSNIPADLPLLGVYEDFSDTLKKLNDMLRALGLSVMLDKSQELTTNTRTEKQLSSRKLINSKSALDVFKVNMDVPGVENQAASIVSDMATGSDPDDDYKDEGRMESPMNEVADGRTNPRTGSFRSLRFWKKKSPDDQGISSSGNSSRKLGECMLPKPSGKGSKLDKSDSHILDRWKDEEPDVAQSATVPRPKAKLRTLNRETDNSSSVLKTDIPSELNHSAHLAHGKTRLGSSLPKIPESRQEDISKPLAKKAADTESKASRGGRDSRLKQKSTSDVDIERVRLVYLWYARLGQPDRQNMKRRIASIESCEISVKDVDVLPWSSSNILNVRKMNELFLSS